MSVLFLVLVVPLVGVGVHAATRVLLWVDERLHAWACRRRELRRVGRVQVVRPINAVRRDPSPQRRAS